MSGGSYEYVMGNYAKKTGRSGLTVSGVPSEHIDIYSGTGESASHLGDATGETTNWYNDYAGFLYSDAPWFYRGVVYYRGDEADVFYFGAYTGGGDADFGFRVVLSITE